MNEREKIIHLWFEMWLTKQDLGIDNIFAEDVIYIESSGPWEIKQFFPKKTRRLWNGILKRRIEEFDGISLVEWTADNKIKSLKEFGCNLNNYNPYEHSTQPEFRDEKTSWF